WSHTVCRVQLPCPKDPPPPSSSGTCTRCPRIRPPSRSFGICWNEQSAASGCYAPTSCTELPAADATACEPGDGRVVGWRGGRALDGPAGDPPPDRTAFLHPGLPAHAVATQ